jgi:hypothetical protein
MSHPFDPGYVSEPFLTLGWLQVAIHRNLERPLGFL